MPTLAERLDGIVDGYYGDSYDYRLIKTVLEEVDFLYSRSILHEKRLGRFIDIIEGSKADATGN